VQPRGAPIREANKSRDKAVKQKQDKRLIKSKGRETSKRKQGERVKATGSSPPGALIIEYEATALDEEPTLCGSCVAKFLRMFRSFGPEEQQVTSMQTVETEAERFAKAGPKSSHGVVREEGVLTCCMGR
jgi:hypothetical protein